MVLNFFGDVLCTFSIFPFLDPLAFIFDWWEHLALNWAMYLSYFLFLFWALLFTRLRSAGSDLFILYQLVQTLVVASIALSSSSLNIIVDISSGIAEIMSREKFTFRKIAELAIFLACCTLVFTISLSTSN